MSGAKKDVCNSGRFRQTRRGRGDKHPSKPEDQNYQRSDERIGIEDVPSRQALCGYVRPPSACLGASLLSWVCHCRHPRTPLWKWRPTMRDCVLQAANVHYSVCLSAPLCVGASLYAEVCLCVLCVCVCHFVRGTGRGAGTPSWSKMSIH
jgi:hypothetical protein